MPHYITGPTNRVQRKTIAPSQPSHPHMGRSLRNPQRLLDKSQTRRLGLWFQASVRVSVVIVRRYCLSDLDSVIAHLPFVDAARYLFCTWVSALYHRPAPVVLWPSVRLIDETCLAHSSPIPDSGFIPAFWITNTHSCLSRATTAGERNLNLNLIRYLTLRSPPIRYDTTTTKSSRMGENGGGEHGVVVAARTTPVSRSSSA